MSHYPPPGEPGRRHPDDYGPPSDPWGTAPAADAWGYDRPPYQNQPYPDPSRRGDPGYGESGYGESGYGESGFGDPGYGEAGYGDPRDYRDRRDYRESRGPEDDNWAPGPPPLPPPRRSTGLYTLVALLAVIAAAGVGYALYLLSTQGDGGGGDTAGEQTPPPAVTTGPTSTPAPSGSPRDNIGLNAATAEVDDCLINDGSGEQPQMRVVACDTEEEGQVYQVLAIFDERVEGENANERAQEICAETEGYRFHYYEVSETASFVLCMTEREA